MYYLNVVVYMQLRNIIIGFVYRSFIKPVFFKLDPEDVHDQLIKVGQLLGKFSLTRSITNLLFSYSNPKLSQIILGIYFSNPVGLAAGFDKDAQLTQILPSVGFGFAEVGSITGESCDGNPKPRLWRLPNSKALVVYYGLKNKGCQILSAKLKNMRFKIPIGISVAKTNNKKTVSTKAGIKDYAKAFSVFVNIGSYITVNISCPNVYGGEPFTDAKRLRLLLAELDKIKVNKPVFVKLSPDLAKKEIDELLKVVANHRVNGLVISNLTKVRNNPNIKDANIPDKGGMSGKVVKDLSDELIKYVYNKTKGKLVIIGCGGVFTAEDAYKKIKAGASLIQLITGMIYQGPQVISEINQGLVELLEKDGYDSISEAIGENSNYPEVST